jgi:hypothetical protein
MSKETIQYAPSNEENVARLESTFTEIQNTISSAAGLDDPQLVKCYEFRDKISALLIQMNNQIPEYGRVVEIHNKLNGEFDALTERFKLQQAA